MRYFIYGYLLATVIAVVAGTIGHTMTAPEKCQPLPGQCVYDGSGVYCVLQGKSS